MGVKHGLSDLERTQAESECHQGTEEDVRE